MKKKFTVLVVSILIGSVAINTLKNVNYLFAIPEHLLDVTLIIVYTRVFFQIYKNLQEFHDYEFKKGGKSMMFQYLVGMFTISIIVGWKIKWSLEVHYNNSKWKKTCDIVEDVIKADHDIVSYIGLFFVWFNNVISVPVFLMAWNILKIKPSEDVL